MIKTFVLTVYLLLPDGGKLMVHQHDKPQEKPYCVMSQRIVQNYLKVNHAQQDFSVECKETEQ